MVFMVYDSVKDGEKRQKQIEQKWNGGYCTDCDGKYEFYQAVGHRHDTTFVYKCDKCGKAVEFDNEME